MVQVRATINKSGNKTHFQDTIGELVESELGYVTTGVKKTINMQNFNSVSVEATVTLPNDPKARKQAEEELFETYSLALEKSLEYLNQMEKTLTGRN